MQRGNFTKKIILVFSLVGITVFGAYMTILLLHSRPTIPVPRAISSQVDFPLYYPTKFPSGFSLDTNSFSQSNKVVTYTVSYEGNKKLIFNIEVRPTNFDFEGFQSNATKISSSIGDAYVGSLGKNTVISITTEKSWIFIGVPSPIDTPALEVILQHLKQVN